MKHNYTTAKHDEYETENLASCGWCHLKKKAQEDFTVFYKHWLSHSFVLLMLYSHVDIKVTVHNFLERPVLGSETPSADVAQCCLIKEVSRCM
jgi:hypothetical protein